MTKANAVSTESSRQRKREQDRTYQRRKRERDRILLTSLKERLGRQAFNHDQETNVNTPTPISFLPPRWAELSQLLSEAMLPAPSPAVDSLSLSTSSSTEFDAHIIITGVLHGWNTVASVFHLLPIWNCLRHMDEIALCHSGPVERLAALRIIALLLRSESGEDMNSQLPPYLWPRPSQLSIQHPKLIDYFIWPGFRERMVFQYHKYLGEDFGQNFSKSFKFMWSASPEAACLRTPESPLYRFTDEFLARSSDISCYRMQLDFLNIYPEFYGDVLPADLNMMGSSLTIQPQLILNSCFSAEELVTRTGTSLAASAGDSVEDQMIEILI